MDGLDRIIELAGAVSIALALLVFGHRFWFLSRAVGAEGQIVDYPEYDYGVDGHGERPLFQSVYGSTVVFRDRRGYRIEFESSIRSFPARRHSGQVVRVLYDPSKPERAFISAPFELWALPVLLVFLGAYALRGNIGAAFG
jgi:hypothetical protein